MLILENFSCFCAHSHPHHLLNKYLHSSCLLWTSSSKFLQPASRSLSAMVQQVPYLTKQCFRNLHWIHVKTLEAEDWGLPTPKKMKTITLVECFLWTPSHTGLFPLQPAQLDCQNITMESQERFTHLTCNSLLCPRASKLFKNAATARNWIIPKPMLLRGIFTATQ